jgi:hypothetical protein
MQAPPPTPPPSPTGRSERLGAAALGALALGVYTALTIALFSKGLFTGGGTIVGAHGDPPSSSGTCSGSPLRSGTTSTRC